MSDACVLFFVKYPEAGRVKTRLGSVIGAEPAAMLYRLFVQDMMEQLGKVRADLRIVCDPDADGSVARYKSWLGPQHSYFAQQGASLGARMQHALEAAYAKGYERVVVLGSDVPDYPHELVQKALDDLYLADGVIGPAFDGGYYLIGFRKDAYLPAAFDGVEWSTPRVFEQTMEHLDEARKEVVRLPDWNDVDTMWDLNVLYRTNRNSSFRRSSSYAALREYESVIRDYDIDLPELAQKRGA